MVFHPCVRLPYSPVRDSPRSRRNRLEGLVRATCITKEEMTMPLPILRPTFLCAAGHWVALMDTRHIMDVASLNKLLARRMPEILQRLWAG